MDGWMEGAKEEYFVGGERKTGGREENGKKGVSEGVRE